MTNFSFRGLKAFVAILMAWLLMGCGGGGTSSGFGGVGAGGSSSSTLVIDLGGNGFAVFDPPVKNSGDVLTAITNLLVSNAWAQISPTTSIFINDEQTAATIIDGKAYISLPPGDYDVCINAPRESFDDPNCQLVGLEPDQVVVISGFADPDTNEVTLTDVVAENAADNVVLFQDPNKENKTLVCHKGKMTISVGTPAALNGHTIHGDSLGPCPSFAEGSAPDAQNLLDVDARTNKGKGKGKGKG